MRNILRLLTVMVMLYTSAAFSTVILRPDVTEYQFQAVSNGIDTQKAVFSGTITLSYNGDGTYSMVTPLKGMVNYQPHEYYWVKAKTFSQLYTGSPAAIPVIGTLKFDETGMIGSGSYYSEINSGTYTLEGLNYYYQVSLAPGWLGIYDLDDQISGGEITTFKLAPLVPGIPEPSTWLFAITGIGAVGGSLRSRRRMEWRACRQELTFSARRT